MAHEPTGYLHAGDVVEFARFTPLTMAERYESGKLDKRSGGVRYEVYRVVTPFGEPVAQRKELKGEGELWDNFGGVEFLRRKKELGRPWNTNRERKLGIVEGMCEAVGMEVERMRQQLGPRTNKVEVRQAEQQMPGGSGDVLPAEKLLDEMSEAEKDIAAELHKLQEKQASSPTTEIS